MLLSYLVAAVYGFASASFQNLRDRAKPFVAHSDNVRNMALEVNSKVMKRIEESLKEHTVSQILLREMRNDQRFEAARILETRQRLAIHQLQKVTPKIFTSIHTVFDLHDDTKYWNDIFLEVLGNIEEFNMLEQDYADFLPQFVTQIYERLDDNYQELNKSQSELLKLKSESVRHANLLFSL